MLLRPVGWFRSKFYYKLLQGNSKALFLGKNTFDPTVQDSNHLTRSLTSEPRPGSGCESQKLIRSNFRDFPLKWEPLERGFSRFLSSNEERKQEMRYKRFQSTRFKPADSENKLLRATSRQNKTTSTSKGHERQTISRPFHAVRLKKRCGEPIFWARGELELWVSSLYKSEPD